MQGWLFYNASKFWDKPSVQALLSKVPDDRMIIIDLAEELWQGWKMQEGFYGKQWIYSVIHNFGGNNSMNGELRFFAENPFLVRSAPNRGALVGMGISPEGVENNEVIYELLTDVEWSDHAISTDDWIREYCISRYGACPETMMQSWKLLLTSVYTKPRFNVRFAYQMRPSLAARGDVVGGADFEQAVRLFLSCASELGKSQLFRNDLIEIVAEDAGLTADSLLRKAGAFHLQSQFALRDTMVTQSIQLMNRIDALVAARPDRRLERWIEYARRWGRNDREKAYYESDAKRQVTVWGGPVLSEYAAKVWSGLIRDYYAQRWKLYYQHLNQGTQADMLQWEEKWITTSANASQEKATGDAIAAASSLGSELDRIKANYLPLK